MTDETFDEELMEMAGVAIEQGEGQADGSHSAIEASLEEGFKNMESFTKADKWAKWDKSTQGLPSEVKEHIRRVFENCDIKTGDPEHVVAALMGHMAALGIELPNAVEAAGEEVCADISKTAEESTALIKLLIKNFAVAANEVPGKMEIAVQAALSSVQGQAEKSLTARKDLLAEALAKDKLELERSLAGGFAQALEKAAQAQEARLEGITKAAQREVNARLAELGDPKKKFEWAAIAAVAALVVGLVAGSVGFKWGQASEYNLIFS